jgi:hypothetical protein
MVEQAKYKVQKKLDDVEFRYYPEMLLATVNGMHDDHSFGILFDYIAGSNRASKKISMTAPVVSSEKIAMTAPVISNDRFFTFVLPSNYTLETVPKPTDERINIHIQPARTFAVLRFSGRTSPTGTAKNGKKLLEILANHKIQTRGDVFLMRYNSPFAPGFMRRNEVGIEVLEK